MENPYLRLTDQFNRGRLRAILASGQAVVLYRLAIMSKDGDWILREDAEAIEHVLATLGALGARYRFGAPLDARWLAHGWSSHFELRRQGLRLRCDFVTRPPRISAADLEQQWQAPVHKEAPIVSLAVLAELKKTNREKDYAVIGDLARLMEDPSQQMLYSRSARDLIRLAGEHPQALAETTPRRPLLAHVASGRDAVERALDEERRTLIRTNEERLTRYLQASREWASIWPGLAKRLVDLGLEEAHEIMVSRAEEVLPYRP
jgi:hypothetical protein